MDGSADTGSHEVAAALARRRAEDRGAWREAGWGCAVIVLARRTRALGDERLGSAIAIDCNKDPQGPCRPLIEH